MKQNETKKVPKSSNIFLCVICHYNTCRKSQYDRHLLTDKHKYNENETNETILIKESSEKFQCSCGKICNSRTTLWRHKNICKLLFNSHSDTNNTNINDKDLILMLIKQNSEIIKENSEFKNIMMKVIENGTHNTTYTNSNNKSFNLQFFLNETCKDAMNIMDFVDSIKLQLIDLEKVGQIGYVDGISNIIVKNLNALEVEKRPVHCTDKKREILYVKDENKWVKEDEEKNKLRKAIKRVASKNQRLLPAFKEAHPDCIKSTSSFSDQYNKMIVESMGGSGDNDLEKEDKIIRNISKNVLIDKVV
jgi:hypothetical protein